LGFLGSLQFLGNESSEFSKLTPERTFHELATEVHALKKKVRRIWSEYEIVGRKGGATSTYFINPAARGKGLDTSLKVLFHCPIAESHYCNQKEGVFLCVYLGYSRLYYFLWVKS
jgi:hypothetical protein